jgi:biopolymer transport protein ExbB/TolQ
VTDRTGIRLSYLQHRKEINSMSLDSFSTILRDISSGLQYPVIILLVALAAVTVILVGTIAAEVFTERRYLKANLPELVDELHDRSDSIPEVIRGADLLVQQKKDLLELTRHPDLSPNVRESLAIRLLNQERAKYKKRTDVTDVVAKIGPILGLLGTLIPLGPGIIALGQGDTQTLSSSLLTAFDTTIAGLACAAVALVISLIRKNWYRNYISVMETLMETILEEEQTPAPDASELRYGREEAAS